MGWPYEFVTLTDEEKHRRRESLDYYGAIAHYSLIAPLLGLIIFKLLRLAVARVSGGSSSGGTGSGSYHRVPGSPTIKAHRGGLTGSLAQKWTKLTWWMSDDVRLLGQDWGQRDQWILGTAWTLWLLVLCVAGTGKDFLHLTKRFGIVAVSQLPAQYILALKAINPLSLTLNTSHERVNRYHRVLGRITYGLLLVHIILYNIFFIESGIWVKRFFAPVVFAGVVASFGMHALNGTALRAVRQWSYRVFFVTHLMTAMFVPWLIFFHAPPVRLYVVEAALIFTIDLAVRKTTSVTAQATLETVPGTDLVKVSIPVPPKKTRQYLARPASHVYLSIPPENRPATNASIFDFLYNPFTVASVDDKSDAVSLVLRRHAGPMTSHLGNLAASSSSTSSTSTETKFALTVEGPYGEASLTFPEFLVTGGAHRVLLFAGGVGATFAVPIYNALVADWPSTKVKLIWAIRAAADATWAVSLPSSTATEDGKSLLDDDNVQLFLTGDMGHDAPAAPSAAATGVEMSDLRRRNTRRPDITKIVDDTFRLGQGETVAVMVCGPLGMTQDVRRAVRPWVMKGRTVWWHEESFGW